MRCEHCEAKLGKGSGPNHVCPKAPRPTLEGGGASVDATYLDEVADVPQVTHFEAADTSPGIKRARKTVKRKTRKVEP